MSSPKTAQAILIGVACAFGVLGCGEPDRSTPGKAEQSPRVGPESVLVDGFGKPTTDGELALGNLTASIGSYRAFLSAHADDIELRAALVGLLASRSQFTGAFADLDEALEHGAVAVSLAPYDAKAHQLLASALGATHRFEDAKLELLEAGALGAKVEGALATNNLAVGVDLDAALARAEAAKDQSRSFSTLSTLAGVRAAKGEFELADTLFLEALVEYRDVSPFPVAWVAFQRGVMWSEMAGRPDLGRPLYAEAVRRLPGYVVANVHLAELEVRDGERDAALFRLGSIAPKTSDPEPHSRLAQFLEATDPNAASQHAELARQGYESLLQVHPLAFADHAAELFMNAGQDPERALELALENLAHRKNDRAYHLAIQASVRAGRTKTACALAALAGPGRASVPLKELQASLVDECT